MARIVNKPWGFESIWAETSNYVGKVLVINGGQRLSRQYHEQKEETFLVNWGSMTLEIGVPSSPDFQTIEMNPGDTYHCPPGRVHRMCAGPIGVHVVEVSTNHLDDVVRITDDYGR